MKTIYIVRHGQTDYNLKGIVQGSGVDSDLNDTGREQARNFYANYHDIPFGVIITSALKRTHQTVAGFIEDGIPWEQHPELNEMGWGTHEGKKGTPESIEEYQRIKNGWALGQIDGRIGGGESARELGDRLQIFVDHLKTRKENPILICSHGRAMCALVTLLMGQPIDRMNEHIHSNLGLWKGEEQPDGHYHFVLRNDRGHLPQPTTLDKKW